MHYLIDGHNLIGKMPDIRLSDADDEIRLIMRLQGWVAGGKQRQVTVVFDGGTMGGVSHRLSSKKITTIFAPAGKTADDLLIKRLKRLRNARNYTLVSSDRRIIDAARIAGVKFLRSETFIERMGFKFQEEEEKGKTRPTPPEPEPGQEDDPEISDDEVQAWLQMFQSRPKRPSAPRRRSYSVLRKEDAPPSEDEPEEAPHSRTPEEFAAMAESDNPELDEAEIAEWLALFGPEPEQKRPSSPTKKKKSQSVRKKKKRGKKPLTTLKGGERKLSGAEVEEWLDLFGGEPEQGQ